MTTPLVTPVMGISSPCILGKKCFDMLKSIGFGDLRIFQVRDDLIGSTLVDLCEIQLGGSLGYKL